jgi:hypothetical protein
MKNIKTFLVNESADNAEFPDVLGSFKDWFGPVEGEKVYEEVFEEIFNVADNGAETAAEVKKALKESWK